MAVVQSEVAEQAEQRSIVSALYELTKPGITQMVAMTTLTGLYVSIPGNVLVFLQETTNIMLVLATIIGTLAVSSGSCVINHVIERKTDAMMKRTAGRPIPRGIVSVRTATTFGIVLTILGVGLLSMVNMVTFWMAVITWVTYIVLYTPLKKQSAAAVLVGGIPGALPFAGGVTAITGQITTEAWIVFAILFAWQMPHFYALSWMYRADYQQGGVILQSNDEKNGTVVGLQMAAWAVVFGLACYSASVVGISGVLYACVAALLSLWLAIESIVFIKRKSTQQARRVLLTSYATLVGVLFMMAIDKL
jgi:heme o synthase